MCVPPPSPRIYGNIPNWMKHPQSLKHSLFHIAYYTRGLRSIIQMITVIDTSVQSTISSREFLYISRQIHPVLIYKESKLFTSKPTLIPFVSSFFGQLALSQPVPNSLPHSPYHHLQPPHHQYNCLPPPFHIYTTDTSPMKPLAPGMG